MRRGAFYDVAKPFRLDEVRAVVREAMEKVRLKRENRALKGQLEALRGGVEIITQNPRMQRLIQTAEQIAPTDCNVLISGASGTAKELLARHGHAQSGRNDGLFLDVNCGAFSEELLATELFGHERGAFTGAVGKPVWSRRPTAGPCFFGRGHRDAASMQVKLLRVIQEREVLRVGTTRPVKVDVRFIAATNRDVQQAVRGGHLRQNLYFRLNVVELEVRPLEQRFDGVPLLAHYFLERYAARMDKPVREIAPEVLSVLSGYRFPGNVRELENLMARGVALAVGARVELQHLPEDLRRVDGPAVPLSARWPSLAEHEAVYLQQVLAEAKGNKTAAARILGIDRVLAVAQTEANGVGRVSGPNPRHRGDEHPNFARQRCAAVINRPGRHTAWRDRPPSRL